MGSVVESLFKIFYRFLFVFFRLVVVNEVNYDCVKYCRVVWLYVIFESVEFVFELNV